MLSRLAELYGTVLETLWFFLSYFSFLGIFLGNQFYNFLHDSGVSRNSIFSAICFEDITCESLFY